MIYRTCQIAQVTRRLLLVREVWGSYPEPIKFPTRCQRSPPLQPWCVVPGAKPRRWAPLTRDTRKGIKRVQWRFDFFSNKL